LQKFIGNAGPVMQKVIEENQNTFFLHSSKGRAAKGNAVELKQTLSFPKELLYLFSDADGQPATLTKVGCIHMFESAPQNKIAISYNVRKASGEMLFIVIVFSVATKKFLHILQCEQEVT
jgi:hypothetical protein